MHLACQLAAVAVTPVNWRATPEELDYIVEDADAAAIVFEPVTEGVVGASAAAGAIARIGLDAAAHATIEWAEIIAATPAEPASRASPEDVSVMLYTSGTTGRAKGVPRRHRVERASAIAHVAQNQYARGETTLGVMPLYHTMGVRSLLSSVIMNGRFICQRRFDPGQALALIERERITNLYLVSTLYHDLLSCQSFETTDSATVRKLGFAGQSMTDGLLKRLDAAFEPEVFVNHYGSSEVYTFTFDPAAPAKPGSGGKAGLNQEIRVVELARTDPAARTASGEEGQIIASLSGDESFDGYWKRPDANEKALHQGWYFTGDFGYFDADGDLFVTGRVDDMILSGGENVMPVEIESVLSLHPAVGEVAVVGLANERWGQQVAAFLTRVGPVSESELDAWCLDSGLAGFKRPRRYVFVASVPKSPVGKILRRKLADGEYTSETQHRTDPACRTR